MAARGCGTIIFTSATAAYRGNAGQHAHAAAMAARKSLSQSIAAELNPKGIHICHVNVDATINVRGDALPTAMESEQTLAHMML
jgi:NAD(P)-dependent dehydrogenase (short-subunit alcohol dehydrogenase family)